MFQKATVSLPLSELHYCTTTLEYVALHCTALHCTALLCVTHALKCSALNNTMHHIYLDTGSYCILLSCTCLHCTALNCTALHCTSSHCTALHCTALHCTALHCTALYCILLHCTTLHYTALLHCCSPFYPSEKFKKKRKQIVVYFSLM